MMPLSRLPKSAIATFSVLVWIGAAALGGNVYGRGAFFLIVAAGALLLAIWLFWRSTQSLTGESPLSLEEALGLAAPSAEEERKQSVLRILKDLEYERAVGKIAEADFRELSEKYRALAKALLSNLDHELGPARERAERLLEARLETDKTVKVGQDDTLAEVEAAREPAEMAENTAEAEPQPSEAKEKM